jgi:hypothetical protein
MDGSSCRADAVTDLENLARLLNVPMPNISKLLPPSVFQTSRGMLSYVQSVAQDLSQFAIIRIVDKSPGSMWGFCRAWVWDQTTAFLHAEKYSISTESRSDLLQGLLDLVQSKGWVASDKARLALLYLIGKGKSLSLKHIKTHHVEAHVCSVSSCHPTLEVTPCSASIYVLSKVFEQSHNRFLSASVHPRCRTLDAQS